MNKLTHRIKNGRSENSKKRLSSGWREQSFRSFADYRRWREFNQQYEELTELSSFVDGIQKEIEGRRGKDNQE